MIKKDNKYSLEEEQHNLNSNALYSVNNDLNNKTEIYLDNKFIEDNNANLDWLISLDQDSVLQILGRDASRTILWQVAGCREQSLRGSTGGRNTEQIKDDIWQRSPEFFGCMLKYKS